MERNCLFRTRAFPFHNHGLVDKALITGVRMFGGTQSAAPPAASLPSGIYFYRLQAGDYVETNRMVVVK